MDRHWSKILQKKEAKIAGEGGNALLKLIIPKVNQTTETKEWMAFSFGDHEIENNNIQFADK